MNRFVYVDKKKSNKPLLGFNLTFPSPDLAEFMGIIGFDYVFIDGEHFAFNIETLQSIARAAKLTNMLPIARVPKNDPEIILEYLEIGIWGIVVPHVNTREDAEKAVNAIKYPPLGTRGAGGRARTAGYGLVSRPSEYFTYANEHTIVIPMIEEEEAFKNLHDILSVTGIDFFDFGPCDLSLSMGLSSQCDSPEVQELIAAAKVRIKNSNKGYVAPVSTIEYAIKAKEEGASLIEFNTNVFLQRQASCFLNKLREN